MSPGRSHTQDSCWALGTEGLCSSSDSSTTLLCGLGQVTGLLWVFACLNQGNTNQIPMAAASKTRVSACQTGQPEPGFPSLKVCVSPPSQRLESGHGGQAALSAPSLSGRSGLAQFSLSPAAVCVTWSELRGLPCHCSWRRGHGNLSPEVTAGSPWRLGCEGC